MKLTTVKIENFRSIKDPIEVYIEDTTTIFLGANDHGKSNLLYAIQKLNADKPILEEERNWDVPQSVGEPRIEWSFSLSNEDKDSLTKMCVPAVVKVAENKDGVEAQSAEVLDATVYLKTNSLGTLTFERLGVNTPIKVISVPDEFEIPNLEENESKLVAMIPNVELFESPEIKVIDSITREELDKSDFMQGIFMLAGIWDQKDEVFNQNPKTEKMLSQASDKLTKELRNTWQQGSKLEWRFSHLREENRIGITIGDPAVSTTFVKPSLRSSGFKTFFYISMTIDARSRKNNNGHFIFMFDEPGTYLHPAAQIDLQRSFEKIAEKNQIIYTTHSIFLISKNYPKRNRVVLKTDNGTKVDQKPFRKNWKAVRESLGVLLSNNFLIADKTLLVEGPSDIVYIWLALRKLKDAGKVDIDLNDINMVDANDKRNYILMAKLMLTEGRKVTALVDGDDGGKSIQDDLKKLCGGELKSKDLKPFILESNKSIENVLADVDTLKIAAKQVATELVGAGLLAYKSGVAIDTAVNDIKEDSSVTLGKTLENVTGTWFENEQSLSKLQVAMKYEDIVLSGGGNINERSAETWFKRLQKEMELRSEKEPESGVIDQID